MTIKSLLVKIGVDTSDLEKGLQTAQNTIEKYRGQLIKTGATLTALGASMTAFFAKAVEGAATQEKAEALLVNMLQNVKGASIEGAQALIQQAQALQMLTGFQDEEIIQAQAMLATFQLTDAQIKEITPRLLDMAAATEKSTGAKADLQSIAIALGKAFTGMTGQLARYGVVLTDEAKTSKDFGAIIESLDMNFKGAAQTVGKTFSGQLSIAKASIGDVMEAIGQRLMPVLLPLIENISQIAQSFANWIGKNQALMSIIVPLGASIGALAVVLGPIIAMLPALAAGFSMLTGPIGIVIAAIAGLITIGTLVVSNWSKIKAFLLEAFAKILSGVASVVGFFAPKLKESLLKTVNNLKMASSSAIEGIKETTEAFKNSTAEAAAASHKTVQQLSESIVNLKKTMTDEIKKHTLSEYEYAKWAETQKYLERKAMIEKEVEDEYQKNALLQEARQAYYLNLQEIEAEEQARKEELRQEELKKEQEKIDLILKQREEMKTKMLASYEFLKEKLGEYTEIVKEQTLSEYDFKLFKLNEWYEKEKALLQKNLLDSVSVKQAIAALDEAYYAKKAALAENTVNTEKKLVEELASAIENIYSKVGESILNLFEKIGSGSKAILEGLKGVVKVVFDSITSVVKQALVEWIASSLKAALASKVQALAALIASVMRLPFPVNLLAVGGALATLYALFRSIGLAEGGIVTSPTLALVGEKGKEVVLPLNKLERYFGKSNTLNQNNYFYGNITSELDLEEISSALARRTLQALQRGRR